MITCVKGTYPPEWLGLSTDDKTTIDNPVNGSSFFEFNTGDKYYYNKDASVWIKPSN